MKSAVDRVQELRGEWQMPEGLDAAILRHLEQHGADQRTCCAGALPRVPAGDVPLNIHFAAYFAVKNARAPGE